MRKQASRVVAGWLVLASPLLHAACDSVDACLAEVIAPDTPQEVRYHAKLFLDDHPTPEVLAAVLALLESPLEKLRATGWWYVRSNPEVFAQSFDALLAALPDWPDEAYLVADIGGERAWAGLESLALESAQAASFGEALKRIDAPRAVRLGLDVVADRVTVKDADGLIRGVFDGLVFSDANGEAKEELEAFFTSGHSAEVQRRAIIALKGTEQGSQVPATVRRIYSAAAPEVRLQIAREFGNRAAAPVDYARHLEEMMDAGGDELVGALMSMGGLGEAAAPLADRVHALATDAPVDIRALAAEALFEIDRPRWRALLRRLASDPDILIAKNAMTLARADTPASAEIARAAAASHWYFSLLEVRPKRPMARSELELLVISNDATYSEPLAKLCNDGAASPREKNSAWHTPEQLAEALEVVDMHHVSIASALPWAGGWLVGEDTGEWGGRLLFSAAGKPTVEIAKTIVEPLALFGWRGDAHAVVGSVGSGGAQPRIDRLRKNGKTWETEALLTLPSPPNDVVVEGDRLLLRLEGNGWIDASNWSDPRWLGCTLPGAG